MEVELVPLRFVSLPLSSHRVLNPLAALTCFFFRSFQNASGNLRWNEKTHERRTLDFHLDVARQPNYSNARSVLRLCHKWRFDPYLFSLPKARQRLSDAIASRASLPLGAKSFTQPSAMAGFSMMGAEERSGVYNAGDGDLRVVKSFRGRSRC